MPDRQATVTETETQAAIVDAAESLISEHGVGGTSAAMIANRAGVAKSLIFYHFGNKAGVCNAIEARHAEQYAENLTRWLDQATNDFEALELAFLSYYDFLGSDPRVARTMVGFYLDEHQTTEKLARLRMRLVGIAKRAQAEGLIRSDCDPLVMIIMSFSAVEQWYLVRYLFQNPETGHVINDDEYVEGALNILLGGTLPPGRKSSDTVSRVRKIRERFRVANPKEDSP